MDVNQVGKAGPVTPASTDPNDLGIGLGKPQEGAAPPPPAMQGEVDGVVPGVPVPPTSGRPLPEPHQVLQSLSTLSSVSLDMMEALKVLYEAARDMRMERRKETIQSGIDAENLGMAAADEVDEQANLALAGGVIGAGISISAASVVIGGAGANMKADPNAFMGKMMAYQSGGQGVQGAGQIASGGFEMGKDRAEADKVRDQATQEKTHSLEEATRQDVRTFADQESEIMQVLSKIDDANYQTSQSAARNTV